jgi:dephospho-CoA kinase
MGSGKTIVARMFEVLGVPVYYADDAGKRLMQTDPGLKAGIVKLLGPDAYFNDGSLNRKFIAGQVFGNAPKLAALNALVHPAVQHDGAQWMEKNTDSPYVLKEAAILFESGTYRQLHLVIGVDAPVALRVQRIKQRDGIAEKDIYERLARQMDADEKMKKCRFVVKNDDTLAIIPQVLHLHQSLLALSHQAHPLLS